MLDRLELARRIHIHVDMRPVSDECHADGYAVEEAVSIAGYLADVYWFIEALVFAPNHVFELLLLLSLLIMVLIILFTFSFLLFLILEI